LALGGLSALPVFLVAGPLNSVVSFNNQHSLFCLSDVPFAFAPVGEEHATPAGQKHKGD
jgi:hypothetical protein